MATYQSELDSNKNELINLNLKIDDLKPGTAGPSLKPASSSSESKTEGGEEESIDEARATVAEAIAEAVKVIMNPTDGAIGDAIAVIGGDATAAVVVGGDAAQAPRLSCDSMARMALVEADRGCCGCLVCRGE